MDKDTKVFAIYNKAADVEHATDELLANGFAGESISVLHPKNADTKEFAERKHTLAPEGTAQGPYSDLPLNGTLGLLDPYGPQEGALHDALIQMGVPSDWCDRRVVHGKHLISVRCDNKDQFFRAMGLLNFTGASDMSWSSTPGGVRVRAKNA
jgi:hypothetical protein